MRLGVWVAGVVLAAGAARAGTTFEIVAHSVHVDAASKQTEFRLTFNQPPDFFTTDQLGRPANSFQYFYDGRSEQSDFLPSQSVCVIRGPEIRFDGDIPIRESVNDGGEGPPRAEGWGNVRGSVDFELAGDVLTFTVPWDVLMEDDGRFSYAVSAFEFGSLTNTFVETTTIPLPSALGTGAAGLVVLAAWRVIRAALHRG